MAILTKDHAGVGGALVKSIEAGHGGVKHEYRTTVRGTTDNYVIHRTHGDLPKVIRVAQTPNDLPERDELYARLIDITHPFGVTRVWDDLTQTFIPNAEYTDPPSDAAVVKGPLPKEAYVARPERGAQTPDSPGPNRWFDSRYPRQVREVLNWASPATSMDMALEHPPHLGQTLYNKLYNDAPPTISRTANGVHPIAAGYAYPGQRLYSGNNAIRYTTRVGGGATNLYVDGVKTSILEVILAAAVSKTPQKHICVLTAPNWYSAGNAYRDDPASAYLMVLKRFSMTGGAIPELPDIPVVFPNEFYLWVYLAQGPIFNSSGTKVALAARTVKQVGESEFNMHYALEIDVATGQASLVTTEGQFAAKTTVSDYNHVETDNYTSTSFTFKSELTENSLAAIGYRGDDMKMIRVVEEFDITAFFNASQGTTLMTTLHSLAENQVVRLKLDPGSVDMVSQITHTVPTWVIQERMTASSYSCEQNTDNLQYTWGISGVDGNIAYHIATDTAYKRVSYVRADLALGLAVILIEEGIPEYTESGATTGTYDGSDWLVTHPASQLITKTTGTLVLYDNGSQVNIGTYALCWDEVHTTAPYQETPINGPQHTLYNYWLLGYYRPVSEVGSNMPSLSRSNKNESAAFDGLSVAFDVSGERCVISALRGSGFKANEPTTAQFVGVNIVGKKEDGTWTFKEFTLPDWVGDAGWMMEPTIIERNRR